jgi:hypothetical protein
MGSAWWCRCSIPQAAEIAEVNPPRRGNRKVKSNAPANVFGEGWPYSAQPDAVRENGCGAIARRRMTTSGDRTVIAR